MTWIKTHKRTVCLLLAIIGGYILFFLIPKCTPISETEYSKPIPATKIDSVTKAFKIPEVKPNLIPAKKKVYKKKEPELRKEAEKKEIVVHETITNGHIEKDIIDSLGQAKTLEFDVPGLKLEDGVKAIESDQEGNIEVKKRKKFRAWCDRAAKNGKKVLIVIGAGTVIVVVAVLASGG